MGEPDRERAAIIARIHKLRREIEVHFNTVAYYNRIHPEQEPIDPDPDGELRGWAAALDRTLAAEPPHA
jgi:hypothetical protein